MDSPSPCVDGGDNTFLGFIIPQNRGEVKGKEKNLQKDSEPSLASHKRLSRREFALQTSPRLGFASHVISQNFLPLPKQKGRRLATFLFWQGQKDSNPRPMVLETSTLPTELYPCVHFCNAQYYIIVLSKLQAFFQKNFIFFLKKEIRFPKESNFFSVYY